ncbi:hypothetical protein TNCV_4653311 [Trichonephila clavipes]|nr:hypothetical protein TNCV_4653311 [Trichonephila clavipes]
MSENTPPAGGRPVEEEAKRERNRSDVMRAKVEERRKGRKDQKRVRGAPKRNPDEMTDEEDFDENLIGEFRRLYNSKDLLKHIVKDSTKYPKQKNRFSLMRIPEEIQTDICVPTVLNAGISSAI